MAVDFAEPAGAPKRGGAQRIPRPEGWRPGARSPWSAAGVRSADEVIAAVVAADRERPLQPPQDGSRLAAVLIALADGPAGAEVLLTRRTMTVSSHRGEVSFPGGRVDAGESVIDAALREAYEEVALDPGLVQVAGQLEHRATLVSRSYIVPVVAKVTGPVQLVPSPAEVDRILWVSLAELAAMDSFREEWWPHGDLQRPIYFFELVGETVWGATGRILHELLGIAFGDADRGTS